MLSADTTELLSSSLEQLSMMKRLIFGVSHSKKISNFNPFCIAAGCILFEMITRTPLFPGDTEGLQVLEQSVILGTPAEEEFIKLSHFIDPSFLVLLRKCSGIPK